MEPPKLPSHNETLKAHGCPGNPIRKWLGMGWEVKNIDFLRLGMGWVDRWHQTKGCYENCSLS